MIVKSIQGQGIAQTWAVFDNNGNKIFTGSYTEATDYYNLNKDKVIEDAFVVEDEIVNKTREKKGDLLNAKATFHLKSFDTVVIGDTTASSIMTGLSQIGIIRGFELDVATNSIKNISGRPLQMQGTLAIQVSHSGAQPVNFYVFSERSADGVTWVTNNNSLRENTIAKDGIDYRTIASFTDTPIEDGEYVRFRFARDGAGNATLLSADETIDGVSIDGHSFNWTMTERE